MNSKSETSIHKDKINKEKHKEDRKHMCSICKKGFAYKCHVKRHMLSHSEMRSYQCTTCNKQFKRKFALNKHMHSHSGVKPYKCLTCQKWFINKSHLNEHLTIRSGDRPFVCSTCSQQFREKSHLKTHMKTHSVKQFSCPICSLQFRQKSIFRRHLLNHSKKTQDTSESEQNSQQNTKSSLEARGLEIIGNRVTEYEITPSTSMTYFGNVKKETGDGLEHDNPEDELAEADQATPSTSYQKSVIKEESNREDELADQPTPSTSYQRVKQEAEDDVEPTSINLCEHLFLKQEEEIS